MGDYEIRIRGRFDDARSARFGEFTDSLRVHETVLRGAVIDQAELHGVLQRLQDLGFELLEVRQGARPAAR
jgi:hypothetical protein